MIATRTSRGKITSEEMAELLEDYNRMKDSDTIGETILLRSAHQEKTAPDASAGALAGFPKDIQDQTPAEYRTVNEFITATISDDYRNVKSAEIQFGFETKYTAGETVYLIFGIIGEKGTEWIVSKAGVLENGSVSVELQKDQLDKLAGKPFALVAVSKQ